VWPDLSNSRRDGSGEIARLDSVALDIDGLDNEGLDMGRTMTDRL